MRARLILAAGLAFLGAAHAQTPAAGGAPPGYSADKPGTVWGEVDKGDIADNAATIWIKASGVQRGGPNAPLENVDGQLWGLRPVTINTLLRTGLDYRKILGRPVIVRGNESADPNCAPECSMSVH